MTILLLLGVLALSGALAGYVTGNLMHHYSPGAPINMVFGAFGAMACLELLGSIGITAAADELTINSIFLHTGCGIAGGAVLALFAGFVQKTA